MSIVASPFLILSITYFVFLFNFTLTVRFTLTFIFRLFVTVVVALW